MEKGRLLEIKKNSPCCNNMCEAQQGDLLELINCSYFIPFVLPFNLLVLIWNLRIDVPFKS